MAFKKNKIIGTLVPISALRSKEQSPKNFGTFQTGLAFLDWLRKTNQNGWFFLPLNETQLEKSSAKKHISSPYKGYGIGLDPRYLTKRPKETEGTQETEEYKSFVSENKDWIEDYSLFCALRDHFGTDDWRLWNAEIKKCTKDAVESWSVKLAKEINGYKIEQFLLYSEFRFLKEKAKKNNIYLIGDIPYYISLNSPLIWANQELFILGKEGELTTVSGVLWGHFDRQIWGHPLYKWGDLKQNEKIINFWKLRLNYHAGLFDVLRLDHVKGFFKYGVIDLQDPKKDKYEMGPGNFVLGELINYSKKIGLKLFVEDSGHYKLDEFLQFEKKHSLAGMKIYRFSYNEKTKNLNEAYADIPNFQENSVVYTTTHDTETLIEYLSMLNDADKQALALHGGIKYTKNDKEFAQAIRSAIIYSKARIIIIPIQDFLLTTDRINIPGTEKEKNDPNWRYELTVPVEDLPIKF